MFSLTWAMAGIFECTVTHVYRKISLACFSLEITNRCVQACSMMTTVYNHCFKVQPCVDISFRIMNAQTLCKLDHIIKW